MKAVVHSDALQRNLVREPPEEVDDRVHLRDRSHSFPRVTRKPHVVADPLIELHVIGRATYLAAEVPEILDEQVCCAQSLRTSSSSQRE